MTEPPNPHLDILNRLEGLAAYLRPRQLGSQWEHVVLEAASEIERQRRELAQHQVAIAAAVAAEAIYVDATADGKFDTQATWAFDLTEAFIRFQETREAKEIGASIVADRDRLRTALAGLIGADHPDQLRKLEVQLVQLPASHDDMTAMVQAIHALQVSWLQSAKTEGSCQ